MRNVLLIAYEFPPSAGGGVQRLTKFARYLPESGWRPTVLCAEPAWGRPTDASLLEEVAGIEVVRLPARNVSADFARLTAPLKRASGRMRAGTSSSGSARLTDAEPAAAVSGTGPSSAPRASSQPLSTRFMRRFFIDNAEPWSRRVPAEAARLHDRIGFDAILASGPPPSALIASARVARELGLPLIADFRDAWATSPDFRRPEHPALDVRLVEGEREVLREASSALAVSRPIAEEIAEYGGKDVLVVPNGFDSSVLPRHESRPGPLRIAFMGRFYGMSDPAPFFEGVARAVAEEPAAVDLHVDVYGQAPESVRESVAGRGLSDRVTFHGFRPHAEAIAAVAATDVGLVTLADHPGSEANYSGKLFEYLGMGLPVLLVGPPNGVAAELVRDASAGIVAPYNDVTAVAAAIATLARAKAEGRPLAEPDALVVARFERREQVAEVARVLDRAVSATPHSPEDGDARA